MATAARQGVALNKRWSLTRDTQFRAQYEAAAAAAWGNGVLSGGAVTQGGALGVELAAGTVILCEGVTYTLAAAQAYGPLTPSATNYLWGLLTRTPADQGDILAEDTYALVLSHTATNTAPSDAHIPLAVVVAGASSITSISLPAGRGVGRRSVIAFTTKQITLAAYDTNYRIELDFSAHGLFGDVCFEATGKADGAGIVVQEDTGQKTTGKVAFLLYARSMSPYTPYGSYGGALDVELTVTLAGYGWTGATTGPFAGTWGSLEEV